MKHLEEFSVNFHIMGGVIHLFKLSENSFKKLQKMGKTYKLSDGSKSIILNKKFEVRVYTDFGGKK